LKSESKLLLLLCALLLGCSSSDPEPMDSDDASAMASRDAGKADAGKADGGKATPGNEPDGGSSAAAPKGGKVGEFSFKLTERDEANDVPAVTSFFGRVSDGPAPAAQVWDKLDEADGCVLTEPRSPFCPEGCGADVCVEDDTCQAHPTAVGVGKVTFTGVKSASGASEFVSQASPQLGYNYQLPSGLSLAYPAFEDGVPVKLSAEGEGAIQKFTLEADGFAPLVLMGAGDSGLPLDRGKGLTLAWEAPAKAGDSRIQVKLDISHHGGAKGKIECDVDDDGSLVIPASLTDKLLDLGVAGFPTVSVTRSSIASTETAVGRVDLKLYMYVETSIVIDGLISCERAEQCPAGKMCGPDKACH